MTLMVAPRGRSATAKNSAMAIAAGLTWRAIFVFIGIRLYLFLRKIFTGVAKIFGTGIFLSRIIRITRDRDTIRDQEETVEQHRVYHLVARAAVH
jgi:hypothetical protein